MRSCCIWSCVKHFDFVKGPTVLCNWNWSWKRNPLSFPFHFPHLFHTNFHEGNFLKQFPLIFPLFPGEKVISQLVNSVSPLGKHNSPIFPLFPQNFPRIPPKFTNFPWNFPPIFPKFPRNSPIFPEFPRNSPISPKFPPNSPIFPEFPPNFRRFLNHSYWFILIPW